MHVLSLEVSTSSAKCILYSKGRGVLHSETVHYPEAASDGITQDAGGITDAAFNVLRKASRKASDLGVEVDGLGLCGTWHSLLLADEGLRPIGRIRTWADLSGANAAASARARGEAQGFYERTGCALHGMYPCWKLAGLSDSGDSGFRSASYVMSQLEWLYLALTGERAASTCLASGSGLLNSHTLDWDEEAVRSAGITKGMLSPLKDLFYMGRLSKSAALLCGLREGLPVSVGGADGAMNQLAVGGSNEGVMSVSVGTSGALRRLSPAPKTAKTTSTWCYNISSKAWIAGAAVNNATNCLDWLLKSLGGAPGDVRAYEDMDSAASEVDRVSAPIFLPFIFGERCPSWQETRRGGFYGLSPQHGPGALYYSIQEGILFNMLQCYMILEGLAGEPARTVISGGITRSDSWVRMAADILGIRLEVTGAANDSTVGAALVAIAALEGRDSLGEVDAEPSAVYLPREENSELFKSRYERYLELYGATGPK